MKTLISFFKIHHTVFTGPHQFTRQTVTAHMPQGPGWAGELSTVSFHRSWGCSNSAPSCFLQNTYLLIVLFSYYIFLSLPYIVSSMRTSTMSSCTHLEYQHSAQHQVRPGNSFHTSVSVDKRYMEHNKVKCKDVMI